MGLQGQRIETSSWDVGAHWGGVAGDFEYGHDSDVLCSKFDRK